MAAGSATSPGSSAASWRPLIRDAMGALWPDLPDGPSWVEAQVTVESAGDPRAESPVGAAGLLQLMPGTAAEVGVTNVYDPAQNLRGGITYLRKQYEALSQVPTAHDRLYWAFASYNAGRGYVNRALALAEMDKSLPGADQWWRWSLSWRYLPHRLAQLSSGKWADYHQVCRYVGHIQVRAALLGVPVHW